MCFWKQVVTNMTKKTKFKINKMQYFVHSTTQCQNMETTVWCLGH